MIAIQFFIILAAASYTLFMLWILSGLSRLKKSKSSFTTRARTDSNDFISVVIAARNEEAHIFDCLNSIRTQTYRNFELIVIDDASTDQTKAMIEAAKLEELKLISLKESSGKKNALAKAIGMASGEIIVCTDADCLVPKTWLEEISIAFQNEEVGFLAMPTVYMNEQTLFQKAESLDFLGLVAIGASMIELKKPSISTGANIAYGKKSLRRSADFRNRNLNREMMNKSCERLPEKEMVR